MVVLGQGGCIRVKVVVFGKSECIRTKWSCSCKSNVREKWLYSGKVVVSGQTGYIRVKWLYSGKSFCIRAKVFLFGQKRL